MIPTLLKLLFINSCTLFKFEVTELQVKISKNKEPIFDVPELVNEHARFVSAESSFVTVSLHAESQSLLIDTMNEPGTSSCPLDEK